MEAVIKRIVSGNKQLADFWSNSNGWASDESAALLSKSRLDWQVELSSTLCLWDKNSVTDGELILAWANLGALIEGTLKLFLAVHYTDYKKDIDNFKGKNGEMIDPDGLALEKLKQFFKKKDLLIKQQIEFIEYVQQRRNVIHAFKDKPIGTKQEFNLSVSNYLELMLNISSRLPYPDDNYEPNY